MKSLVFFALSAIPLIDAQYVPPPDPVLLTTTKSGVLPVLPTPFNGVETLEGAIIMKAPANASYIPVNGPAQVQSNLPAGTYVATLPEVPFNALTGTVISGTVTGSANEGDTGVTFTVSLTGLPNITEYGPFPYHIHNQPVPEDGNCTSTLGHFDYTNAGEYYTCATNATQNCQTGDLAGKHGRINATTFTVTYNEKYLSTDPSSPYFFGALSIVIHTRNTTRLTCANFTMMMEGSPTEPSSSSTQTGAPVATFTGAASKTVIGTAVLGLSVLLKVFLW